MKSTKIISVLLIVLLAFSMIGCNKNVSNNKTNNETNNEANNEINNSNSEVNNNQTANADYNQNEVTSSKNGEDMNNKVNEEKPEIEELPHPLLTIEVENYGNINLELLPEIAPNTVNNFITLANEGFYEGLRFHRIIEGFMIQGGCPNGDGTGGPGYSIKAEFTTEDGYYVPHIRGVISMARAADPDSAGSQFFIVHQDSPHLDGQYTSFGYVRDKESMDVVDEIAKAETTGDIANENILIKKITVDLNGHELGDVEKIEE